MPRLSEGAQQHPLRCISKLKPAELALVTTGFSDGVLRLLCAAVEELHKAFEAFDGGCPPKATDGDEPCLGKAFVAFDGGCRPAKDGDEPCLGKFEIPPEVGVACRVCHSFCLTAIFLESRGWLVVTEPNESRTGVH